MKKILTLAAGLVISSAAFAAPIGPGPTQASVTNTECSAITTGETVKLNVSKSNFLDYSCSTIAIGVAVANASGKGKVYSTISGGGAITEASCAAAACIAGDATTAAGTALTAAGS